MKLISAIHRWTGAVIGLLLTVLGLTGAILVWEGSWVGVAGASDPLAADPSRLVAITRSAAGSEELSRITYASDEIGLHQLVFADGSGAYVDQAGRVAETWTSQWQRPELWLFDLHHHLFAGHSGEVVTGIAGLAGIGFAITGFILWWRTRRKFALRLWPDRMAPGPIVRHHRDVGVVMLPLLLLSMVTGTLMIFDPLRTALIGEERRPAEPSALLADPSPGGAIAAAAILYPEAEIRRITLPKSPGEPIHVRLRQPFEWTPNGRTQLILDSDGSVSVEDSARANGAARIGEKLYPLHSAKVGGLAWKLAMTLSGLALALLGSLATWSFWKRRSNQSLNRRRSAPSRRATIPA